MPVDSGPRATRKFRSTSGCTLLCQPVEIGLSPTAAVATIAKRTVLMDASDAGVRDPDGDDRPPEPGQAVERAFGMPRAGESGCRIEEILPILEVEHRKTLAPVAVPGREIDLHRPRRHRALEDRREQELPVPAGPAPDRPPVVAEARPGAQERIIRP